jgi:hypothetical protein
MRLKYIEERISPYFMFGEHKDGFVDIASKDDDSLITHISKRDADKIIKERDFVIDLLHKLSEKCGDDFDKIWYDNVL